MLTILWTENEEREVPWEYLELMLCREVYHCTPSELAEQPADVVQMHLSLINAENRVRKLRNK